MDNSQYIITPVPTWRQLLERVEDQSLDSWAGYIGSSRAAGVEAYIDGIAANVATMRASLDQPAADPFDFEVVRYDVGVVARWLMAAATLREGVGS